MNSLETIIKQRILSQGPISFETFMDMCLYYPELGYYTKPNLTIGKSGDFYTSPHLHSLFGALIAKQLVEMWQIMNRPHKFSVVEMGGGMGYLCKDIFDYFTKTLEIDDNSDFYEALDYKIIEISPYLRDKQRALLSNYSAKITWYDDIKSIPEIVGCFLSNEFFDALPVRIIEVNEKLYEIYVDVKDDEFIEVHREPHIDILGYLSQFNIDLTPYAPYRTEVCLGVRNIMQIISKKLNSGFVITVDYGYSADDYYCLNRNRGTLLCYYRHRVVENPYINIGDQDITAHVNFSALKKYGEEYGLTSIGFTSQSAFLISLGIEEVLRELHDEKGMMEVMSKAKGLFLPQGLGETHKVLVQCKNIYGDTELKGFKIRNKLNWL